jgi:hypothetical protein
MIERIPAITIAAALYIVTGLAYSIGTIPVTRYLIRYRSLATWVSQTSSRCNSPNRSPPALSQSVTGA